MCESRGPVRWWVWVASGIALAALLAAIIVWWRPVYGFVSDLEKIQGWTEGFGVWGPLAIIFLQVVQALLAPIPGQAMQAVSGLLYGPWLGTLYSVIGMVLGSSLVFWLARRFGRPLVVWLIGRQSMDRLDDLVRRGGAPIFFLIWLFPFAPDDLACVAAGLTPMPPAQFLVLMSLGRMPGIVVSVLVGANITQVEPVWWGVLLGVVAVAALAFWRWGEQIQQGVLRVIEWLSGHLWE